MKMGKKKLEPQGFIFPRSSSSRGQGARFFSGVLRVS